MPKLAIYVPKKDMRQIERWRKRINFSQVFMRALQREIRERSRRIDAPASKLETAARFYRDKLRDDSTGLVDLGHRIGCEHVLECRLAPETIRTIRQITDTTNMDDRQRDFVEKTIRRITENIEQVATEQGYDSDGDPTRRDAVVSGYVQGVVDAWKQVCATMGQAKPQEKPRQKSRSKSTPKSSSKSSSPTE